MMLMDIQGHLISDTSQAELHAFAFGLRLRRCWYQDKRLPHYDLTTSKMRQKALRQGPSW